MMGAMAILVEPPNQVVAPLRNPPLLGPPGPPPQPVKRGKRKGGERYGYDTPDPAAHVSCVRAQQNTPSVGRTAPLATELS